MGLIKFEDYKLTIQPEALLLKGFSTIWKRDKSKSKESALQELSFIYFVLDPRSDYRYIQDQDTREDTVRKHIGLPDKWKPDKEILKAMEIYKETMYSSSYLLLEDAEAALEKLRQELRNIDLKETVGGKRVYTINSIASTIKQIPQIAKDITEAKELVFKEITEQSKARGSSSKKLLEDGLL